MHIPDGVLDVSVCAVTGLVSMGTVGFCLHKLKDSLSDRTIPLTGMMSALVFAGQMVNFPIAIFGIPAASGHLVGGVLAAVILGPWAGCLAITLVLVVQCALFADGGLLTLGANVLNMGVVGSLGGFAVYTALRRMLGNGIRGTVVGVVVASWLTVVASSALFCLELWISHAGEYNFPNIFALMVVAHSAIGVGEAFITGGVISFVLSQRPNLIYEANRATGFLGRVGRLTVVGVVVAMAMAAFLAPFASPHPDGLESAGEQTGFLDGGDDPTVLFANGYTIPLPVIGWENAPYWQKVSVSLAGILGTTTVLVIALLLGYTLKPFASPAEPRHDR